MADGAGREEEDERKRQKREKKRMRGEERASTGVARGRTRLYYTKGTDEGTHRPSLPLMMLYSRLPTLASYLLAASRCSFGAQDAYIVARIARPRPPPFAAKAEGGGFAYGRGGNQRDR